jgi:hypothetical protein
MERRVAMKRTIILHWLVGSILTIAASAAGAWTSDGVGDSNITRSNTTRIICNWSGVDLGLLSSIEISDQPSQMLVAPETNTMTGFGAALLLNGLGVAGSGIYLRRRYNRDSAKRYAGRNVARLPLFLDTAFSVAVLVVVGPVLMAVAVAGAFVTGAPKVYGCSKLVTASSSHEITGAEAL